MQLAVTNPNFSIVVPTGCNAKCNFCFWEEKATVDKEVYLSNLVHVLSTLPKQFEQCSITGGEPTMLDWLSEILILVRPRFKKIVLSSNGYNVRDNVLTLIDHLNISRHDPDDIDNADVFNTSAVPDGSMVAEICQRANDNGVDVTLNCVLDSGFNDDEFIHDYIGFAKTVGASSVCFRKIHSNLEDLPVEKLLSSKVIDETGCPACRSKVRLVQGMKTTWRYSVLEPSKVLNGIYELVLQPSGKVTADWKGNQVISMEVQKTQVVTKDTIPNILLGQGNGKTVVGSTPKGPAFTPATGCGGNFGMGSCGSPPQKKQYSYSSCGSSGC